MTEVPEHLIARARRAQIAAQAEFSVRDNVLPPVVGPGNLNDAVACVDVALDNLRAAQDHIPHDALNERRDLRAMVASTEQLLGRLLVRQRDDR